MTTQEKEWREKIYNLVKEVHIQKPFEDVTGEPHYVTDEIMKLLDQHSAHLVERITASKRTYNEEEIEKGTDPTEVVGFNLGIDRAIDIVKSQYEKEIH